MLYCDIAWAAGLFEGEGSFILRKDGYVQASLQTTDLDVLERFMEIVECGNIGCRRTDKRPGTRKDAWLWQIGSRYEVRRLAEMFMPYLGARRKEKALEIIAATDGWESAPTSKHKTVEFRQLVRN